VIPEAAHTISKPAFIGVSQRDDICIAAMQERQAAKYCLDRRVQRYDGDHWIILSHADDIARDLLSWIGGLGAGAQEDSVQL
jgi:soluble epoxide hydrolase/lipid-phosphate phosphatase